MALHLSTAISHSPLAISSHIAQVASTYASKQYARIFALSSNIPQRELLDCVRTLTEGGETVGSLTRPVAHPSQGPFSCSLAVFDAADVVTFRSDIPGKTSPQVGRWHAFRRRNDEQVDGTDVPWMMLKKGVDWADVWNGNTSTRPLPEVLRPLRSQDVNAVVYMTDDAPEGLSNVLNAHSFPTFGLVGASTPFTTGRPFTLFRNDRIYGSGAVGLALRKKHATMSVRTEFLGACALSGPMTVTSCQGNMINSLDHSNPAQLLLSSVHERLGEKKRPLMDLRGDEQLSIGVLTSAGVIARVYRITAGDPDRASISLDSPSAPPVGTSVKFLHHRPGSLHALSEQQHRLAAQHPAFAFSTVPEPTPEHMDEEHASEWHVEKGCVVLKTFLAASENGIIVRRAGEDAAWKSSVVGGVAFLEWGEAGACP